MTFQRVLLAVVLVMTAALVQVVVVNPWQLPGGGPLLVLLVVIGLAVVQGPLAGAVTGFGAGLLVDLLPPAAGVVGLNALVLCLAGFAAGHLRLDARRSVWIILTAVAGLSAAVVVASAALGALFGAPPPPPGTWTRLALGAVLYDVLLAPFVVPLVMGLARRVEPDPSRLLV